MLLLRLNEFTVHVYERDVVFDYDIQIIKPHIIIKLYNRIGIFISICPKFISNNTK